MSEAQPDSMRWIVFTRGMSGTKQFIGTAKGPTLEDAIINGMMDDYQFKTTLRESMPLDSTPSVELYGVPKQQVRSTVIQSSKLTKGNSV